MSLEAVEVFIRRLFQCRRSALPGRDAARVLSFFQWPDGEERQRLAIRIADLPAEKISGRPGRLAQVADARPGPLGFRPANDVDGVDFFNPLKEEMPADGQAQQNQENSRQAVHLVSNSLLDKRDA